MPGDCCSVLRNLRRFSLLSRPLGAVCILSLGVFERSIMGLVPPPCGLLAAVFFSPPPALEAIRKCGDLSSSFGPESREARPAVAWPIVRALLRPGCRSRLFFFAHLGTGDSAGPSSLAVPLVDCSSRFLCLSSIWCLICSGTSSCSTSCTLFSSMFSNYLSSKLDSFLRPTSTLSFTCSS